MLQYVPYYLTDDFRQMPKEARSGRVVRWGEIDTKRLLEAISGMQVSNENIKSSERIITQAIAKLSRCQRDLLKMEFGAFRTRLDRITPDYNILEVYSLDKNLRLLRKALEKIELLLQPGRKMPTQKSA